jgi:hypothetical protein
MWDIIGIRKRLQTHDATQLDTHRVHLGNMLVQNGWTCREEDSRMKIRSRAETHVGITSMAA